MRWKGLLVCVFVTIQCFGQSPFLEKGTHIPPSSQSDQALGFSTTRSLKDGSLKKSVLRNMQHLFGVEIFVETGTYLGDTTAKSAYIFDQVHTIELSKKLYQKAKARLEPWKNVTVHWGDSSQIFPELLPYLDKRVLFYLDGHYSGHITAKGTLATPLIDELQCIAEAKKGDSVILIDDIRLFQPSLYPEKIKTLGQDLEIYPYLEEIVKHLLCINPRYQICFLGDALLAFPGSLGVFVSPVMRSCAIHRLEHLCLDLTEQDVKEADKLVGRAQGKEKKQIEIYYKTYSPFELDYGYRSYGCFWQGLVLQENGYKKKAKALCKRAKEQSVSPWSIERFFE